jgi:hypothetical protein
VLITIPDFLQIYLEVIFRPFNNNGFVRLWQLPLSKSVEPLVLSFPTLIQHGSTDFVGPDVSSCGAIYGALSTSPCQVALQGLPSGSIPSIFTTRTSASDNNFVTVPKRYVDSETHPSCAITIDLDGHSKDNVFVLVPWKKIRTIVQDIIDGCVDRSHWGGFETFGLQRTFDAVIDPTLFEPNEANNAVPAQVEQPDGTLDTTVVATPPDTSSSGYGKLFRRSQSLDWSAINNLSIPLLFGLALLNRIEPKS